ncbi:hypothetical protein VTK26DRAFT_7566 [Humicola hyalothermophila]
MAHLPPNAAIFSPSVARAAASAAKDWSYVDSWLQRKFPGRGPPPFERNAETLRALLALASANEAADEERALVARLEAETLEQLRAFEQSQQDNGQDGNFSSSLNPLADAREAILASLESSLTREGQTALNAMASLAVQAGIPFPTPADLGAELISLATQSALHDQTLSRLQTLNAYISAESDLTSAFSSELRPPSPTAHPDQDEDSTDPASSSSTNPNPATDLFPATKPAAPSSGYHPSPTLAIQNLSAQRRIKALASRLAELRDKAASLHNASPGHQHHHQHPTIAQVRAEEEAYLALLSQKRALDARLQAFAGLPPDAEQARRELDQLRQELRQLALRRDEAFEGLVEKETPRKQPAAQHRRGPGGGTARR